MAHECLERRRLTDKRPIIVDRDNLYGPPAVPRIRPPNLAKLIQAKRHFSTFQTQPGKASRRCRRPGSIVSLALLWPPTHKLR